MLRIKLQRARQARITEDANGAVLEIETPEMNADRIHQDIETLLAQFVDSSPQAKAEMHDGMMDVIYKATAVDWIRSNLLQ